MLLRVCTFTYFVFFLCFTAKILKLSIIWAIILQEVHLKVWRVIWLEFGAGQDEAEFIYTPLLNWPPCLDQICTRSFEVLD